MQSFCKRVKHKPIDENESSAHYQGCLLYTSGITRKDLGDLKEPVDYAALCKLAVDYSDGVIQNSEKVDESIIEYARQSGKLVLDYQNPENYADACNEFYDQVWEAAADNNKEE